MVNAIPSSRRRDTILLLAVVVLALAVRTAYWMDARGMPLDRVPTGDAATYVYLAQELQAKGPLAPLGEPYQQAPLYPLFLWNLRHLGFDLAGIRMVQFLLGTAGAAILALLGRRLAGRTGALVAGLGGAIYGPFVFYESDILSIALAVFFIELALVLWGRARWALTAGVCFGLAALVQPNFLIAGLAAAGLSLGFPRALGWDRRRSAMLLAAGLLLPPTLTLTRNLVVSGEPILISANGGISFFIGNNGTADGALHLPPGSGLWNRTEGLYLSARQGAEAEAGRSLSYAAVDRFWWLRGIDFWITEPGRALGLTLDKVILALNDAEIASHHDYDSFRGDVTILRALPTFGCLLPLGGLGLVLAWRRRRDPLVVLFGAFLISVIPFFVTGRHRLPLAVFLWPAAGLAVREIWASRRNLRALIPLGTGVAAYTVLAFFPLHVAGPTRAHVRNAEATTLVQQGDLAGAPQALEEAQAILPNHPETLNNMAYVAELRGDLDKAATLYEQAIAADPGRAETYLNLEDLHRQAGRPADALESLDRLEQARGGRVEDVAAAMAYRRGINTLSLGDTLTARAHLESAVARNPEMTAGWLTLSTLYRKLELPEKALLASDRAVALGPQSPEALANQGRSLELLGRREEALAAYLRAIEVGGPDPDLSARIGQMYAAQGKLQEAESAFMDATRGRPHPAALLALGHLYESQRRWSAAKAAYRKVLLMKTAESVLARERLVALGVLPPKPAS